ncbi:hypothetical protein VNI00_008946 [Paramarasmius palmivorus]|uniref:Uncharacterized protein n=1 Tax=Paramarasmius palmivorus TaxID=297713 RepID=A0AAW0CPC6_9AGAR
MATLVRCSSPSSEYSSWSTQSPSEGSLAQQRALLSALEDQRVHFERLLADKDDVICMLRKVLSQINVASPRRPRVPPSNEFLERAFQIRHARYHAIPSIYDSQDWQHQLDGITQLHLSLQIMATGFRVNRLEAVEGTLTNNVHYNASCSLEAPLPPAFSESLSFHFDLCFEIREVSCGTGTCSVRFFDYRPCSTNDLPSLVLENFDAYSAPASQSFERLSSFIQNVAISFRYAVANLNINTFAWEKDVIVLLIPTITLFSVKPPLSLVASLLSYSEENMMPDTVETGMSPSDPSLWPLVCAMPWFTAVATDPSVRFELLPADFQPMSRNLLEEFRKFYGIPAYREVMYNRESFSPLHKGTACLATHLFTLKVLDVVARAQTQDESTTMSLAAKKGSVPPRIVPRSIFLGETSKLRGISSISDNGGWPRVLYLLQNAMLREAVVEEESDPDDVHPSSEVRLLLAARRQLRFLTRRGLSSRVLKALQNINAASFYLNYMLQNNVDLPGSTQDLVAKLQRDAENAGILFSVNEDLPIISRLRQPLLLALSVSPIILLSDIAPMSANLTKLSLLRAWFHYGTSRPPILSKMETLLWQQLIALARGTTTALHALQSFMKDALVLLSLALPERHFFGPSQGISVELPRALLHNFSIANGVSQNKESVTGSSATVSTAVGKLSFRLFSSGAVTNVRLEVDVLSWWEYRIMTDGLPGRIDGVPYLRNKHLWRPQVQGDVYLLFGPKGRRAIFWPTCYESPMVDYLVGLLERCNWYQIHHGNAQQFFKLSSTQLGAEDNIRFSESQSGAVIRGVIVLSIDEFARMDASDLLSMALPSTVIVALAGGSSRRSHITKATLSRLGSYLTLRHIVDLSDVGYHVSALASFSDYLSVVQSTTDNRIFFFPYIPAAESSVSLSSMSTNRYSRQYVRDISRHDVFDDSSHCVNWHFLATAHAFHAVAVAPDGMNVELVVGEGSIVVFVGISLEKPDFLANLTVHRRHHNSLLCSMPSISALLLGCGDRTIIRAGTPYAIVSLEAALCHGHNFYSYTAMEQSWWSVIFQFFNSAVPRDRILNDRRSLLLPIAVHWHDVIVNHAKDYFGWCAGTEGEFQHIPNLYTLDGIIQLFSLFAFLELAGILEDKRYASGKKATKPEERQRQAESLRIDILSALDQHLLVGHREQDVQWRFPTLWTSFLVQQVVALLFVARHVDHPTKTASLLESFLAEDLHQDPHALELVSKFDGLSFV